MTETDATVFDPPRQARAEDLPALLKTANYVHRILKNSKSTIEKDWGHIYDAANVENVIIITTGEQVAATVGIRPADTQLGPVTLKVGGINCLATLPEHRRRGLGAAVMDGAHRRMRDMGCHVSILGTGIVNWYRSIGWEMAGVSRSYRLDRASIGLLPALPEGVALCVLPAEAATDVLPLRHADRLGCPRSPEVFARLLAVRSFGARIVAARRGAETLAYFLARAGSIIEWGGPAELVAGLARAWQAKCDDPTLSTSFRDASFRATVSDEVTLSTPATGHPLIEMLDRLRIPHGVGYKGMMYLVDPRGILDAFGHQDIALCQEGETFALTRGDETTRLDRRTLTKLFFGPERVSDFADDVFPLPFWQWPFESV